MSLLLIAVVIVVILVLLGGGAMMMRKPPEGPLAQSVRDQTVADFVKSNKPLLDAQFPGQSEAQRTRLVDNLIEAMVRRASMNNRSENKAEALTSPVFLPSAAQVASEQSMDANRAVAYAMVDFFETHPLWFGKKN